MEYKGSSTITYEPFRAGFTGMLVSFKGQDGLTYTLNKPYMKIQKGQHFMLAIDRKTMGCRLIPVVPPDPHYHS